MGEILLFTVATVWLVVIGMVVYWVWFRDTGTKSNAREDIFEYVKAYKRRCTGANRFVVTVETLQDSFREYETVVINAVWMELVKEHVIERDPEDGEWCVR